MATIFHRIETELTPIWRQQYEGWNYQQLCQEFLRLTAHWTALYDTPVEYGCTCVPDSWIRCDTCDVVLAQRTFVDCMLDSLSVDTITDVNATDVN